MNNIEIGKFFLLRVKIIEASLSRNVAKFGSMSPYVEIS